MENFGKLYVHFEKSPLISSTRTATKEVQDPNIAKEALRSNQIEMGSKNRQQKQLPNAILFKPFHIFSAL